MHSLEFLVGVVLTGKDNYLEWSRKIKVTIIYNDMLHGICEGTTIKTDVGMTLKYVPNPPTLEKEPDICHTKDNKELAMIIAIVSEKMSQHILLA